MFSKIHGAKIVHKYDHEMKQMTIYFARFKTIWDVGYMALRERYTGI